MNAEDRRPTPHRRGDYPVFRRMTTRWRDNDIYAHVNNAIYYEYIDSAVNGWLLDEGLLDPTTGAHIGLVVASHCSFFAPIAFPDAIDCGLRVTRIGGSSVDYEVGLFLNDATTAAAQGGFRHVHVDRETRTPRALDDRLRGALERLRTPA